MSAANPAADSTWTACAVLPCVCGLCPKASALPAITPEVLALVQQCVAELRSDEWTSADAAENAHDMTCSAMVGTYGPVETARDAIIGAAWALLAAQVASDAARLAATGECGR